MSIYHMTLLYASWMTRNQAADTTPEVYAQDTCDHVNRLYLYIYTRERMTVTACLIKQWKNETNWQIIRYSVTGPCRNIREYSINNESDKIFTGRRFHCASWCQSQGGQLSKHKHGNTHFRSLGKGSSDVELAPSLFSCLKREISILKPEDSLSCTCSVPKRVFTRSGKA